jgi:hypothetical protein
MREALKQQTCKGGMENNRFLTKTTSFQAKQQNATIRCWPQGQDELTRPSWNAQFDKERDRQVAEISENLIQCQPITNMVSR